MLSQRESGFPSETIGHDNMHSAKGYFHIEVINGTYWLVDPEGHIFISKGVNHIDYMGDYAPKLGYSPYYLNILKKYGSIAVWVNVTTSRLLKWGFNTIGAWSSMELYEMMPYTYLMSVGGGFGFNWQTGQMPDIFSDNFVDYAEKAAHFDCEPRRNDTMLIGYFTDNELRWGPDWRSRSHLLDDFIKLPQTAPGKKVAVEVIRHVLDNNTEALNEALGTSFSSFDELLDYVGFLPLGEPFDTARKEFLKAYAERYFSVVTSAIREADPNHLILGVRFSVSPTSMPPDEVFEEAGKYVDVISLNLYNFKTIPKGLLGHIYNLTHRPIMITEFSFRARDSGLPNTIGAGITVDTQAERANYTRRFVEGFMELPYAVGYHWFEYADEPKEGRFDGENSNYGLVRIDDAPYEEMVEMFQKLNSEVEQIHMRGRSEE